MKQDRQQQAEQLIASLELSLPPIAIAFRDAVPDGIPEFDGSVPAGCVFWQEAAKRTFATSAKHHALCSIGIHTLNLSQAPASQPEELRTTLEAMTGLDYVREEEVAAIPVVRREVKHALYGPLADFPADPEVVLLFADARQGLVLSEAVGRVDGGVPPAMGRPACAVVPQTLNHGLATMSLGCCGARAYLDALSDDTALWALPGGRLDQYCDQIVAFANANRTLAMFHERRRADVESGQRPTVRESLQRLS
jgi:uncharacterized protein (DUF169 family)